MKSTTTAVPVPPPHEPIVWNVPNQISAARIVVALVCFVTICLGWYLTSLVLFLVAAVSDMVDGYLARRFNQITQLGRILDPFADKVIVCGTFILLGATAGSLVAGWMAVVVTARELLVTALRGLIEGRDMDFSARQAGKWKMVLQCAAIAMSLWRLAALARGTPTSLAYDNLTLLVIYMSLIATVYSGWGYVRLAGQMMHGEKT